MRPAVVILLLGMGGALAAPVPKTPPKTVSRLIVGVWRDASLPSVVTVVYEFDTDGGVVRTFTNHDLDRKTVTQGKYTVTEWDEEGKGGRVELKFDTPDHDDIWLVQTITADGVKLDDKLGRKECDYVPVKAKK
jgi:hypothetical protein